MIEMTKVYPAIIHSEDGGFWIEFPDLPGCFSDGDTLEDLMDNAEEALGAFLAVKMDYRDEIPDPSDINKIAAGPSDIKTYISTVSCV